MSSSTPLKESNKWKCTVCTFINNSPQLCQMCKSQKINDNMNWKCLACSFENPLTAKMCLICNTKKSMTLPLSFKSTSRICNKFDNNASLIDNCECLRRLSVAMKYFRLVIDDDENKETVIRFCQNVYKNKNLLHDYYHVIKQHNDDLTQIHTELITNYEFDSCSINQCHNVKRYYVKKVLEETVKENDEMYQFYVDLFDQLHYFIYHLYDVGLRVEIMENKQQHADHDEEISLSDDSDQILRETINIIQQKRKVNTYDVNRFSIEHNKFTMPVNTYNKVNRVNGVANTFLEEMQQYIIDENPNTLMQFLHQNEYDTDALENDLDDAISDSSNIINYVNNPICIEIIKNYIHCIKLRSTSFSTGIHFIYWDDKDEQIYFDPFDYSLLKTAPFYSSLKQEILESGYVSISNWTNKIVFKSKLHQETDKVKKMKYCWIVPYNMKPRHGIDVGTVISQQHLIAIILYCDWSDLCTEFSGTFRSKYKLEPVKLVMKRNSVFFHFSKLLIEAVNDFGMFGFGGWTEEDAKSDGLRVCEWEYEHGPFFCGITRILNVPSFAMKFCAPCSTSKHVEVAINFAKRDGMLLELNNDGLGGMLTKFFDCSWISRYPDENERLFVHCHRDFGLRMHTIRIIETANNYELYVHALYLFDIMVTSGQLESKYDVRNVMTVNSTDVKILNKLISNKLNGTPSEFD
eukprot:374706_1